MLGDVASSLRLILIVGIWTVHGNLLAQDAGAFEVDAGSAPQPNEVSAHDVPSEAEQLQQSPDAVHVIDLRREQGHAADLGEVLARAQGIAVLRDGGLGSGMRFSLNGLYDDQIRFFLDEVPLPLAGYAIDIVNVPVNLIERVDVYRGVVPIRFGADALGGVVNLVTDRSYQSDAGLSYQVGSFGTHRLTLHGRYRHEPSGFVAGGERSSIAPTTTTTFQSTSQTRAERFSQRACRVFMTTIKPSA